MLGEFWADHGQDYQEVQVNFQKVGSEMVLSFFSGAGSNSWSFKRSGMRAFLLEYTCKDNV